MKPQLFMIKVKYNHKEVVREKKLPVKSISIGEEIFSDENNEWIIPTHFRYEIKDSIRQIGIRVPDSFTQSKVLITGPNQESSRTLTYNKKYDVWYEDTKFLNKKNKKNGYYKFDESYLLTGVTSTGTISLIQESTIENKLSLSELGKINFVPSSLSIDDYNFMLTELYSIHESFIKDDRNIAKGEISFRNNLKNISNQIDNINSALVQIDRNPHKKLAHIITKKKVNDFENRRFDLRFEWGKYTSPGKNVYEAKELKNLTQTHENQMIKQVLEHLYNQLTTKAYDITFKKYFSDRLINEQKNLIEKSDYSVAFQHFNEINDLFQMSIPDKKTELIQRIEKFKEKESSIYKNLVFEEQPNKVVDTGDSINEYVEIQINLIINGTLVEEHKYSHFLNESGIHLTFKYDNFKNTLKRVLKLENYKIGNEVKVPNSYFGKITLDSFSVKFHYLMHTLFEECISGPCYVRIVGKVKKRGDGLDPVTRPSSNNGKYNEYNFELAEVNEIYINNELLVVDSSTEKVNEFLNNKISISTDDSDNYEADLLNFKQLEKAELLEEKIGDLDLLTSEYKDLKEKVFKLLSHTFLKDISTDIKISVQPTQLFLHDPMYGLIWNAIYNLQFETFISLLAGDSNERIGTIKSESLYEVWSLFKMIQLLNQEMGWNLVDDKSVHAYLKAFIKNESGLENFTVELIKQSWRIKIYYEAKIDLVPDNHRKPDYIFYFSYNETPIGMSILDAKYRNYNRQGIHIWAKDVKETAIDKYLNMSPELSKWKIPILSSSILHSNVDFPETSNPFYNPYHVFYDQDVFKQELSSENAHQVSSIPMSPSNLTHFKNWFRVQMEYHLDAYKTCWYCGESDNVVEKKLLTKGGIKKYHYSCKSCNEFWVKVHCYSNGHKLIKHMDNYHLQAKKKYSSKWYVVCPCCGDGFSKK